MGGPGSGRTTRASLRRMGVGERTEQLSLALQWMLDGYARALASYPEGTPSRAILEGAFGKLPDMAGDILKGENL